MIDYKQLIKEHMQIDLEKTYHTIPICLMVSTDKIVSLCLFLRDHASCYFDKLTCITGVDLGPEDNQMEVLYHLHSLPQETSLCLKVILDRNKPVVPSVSHIWKNANWLEREIYDLFGIVFQNHPDLRRILLPKDWKGYPLRKDYKQAETYHGISIAYDRK